MCYIAQKQRRGAILECIRRRDRSFVPLSGLKLQKTNAKKELAERLERTRKDATDRRQGDKQDPTPATAHYELSCSQRDPLNLYRLVSEQHDDPATKEFILTAEGTAAS